MKPLAGLKILDFSRVLAGPMATQIFADFGAEVIKIESLKGDEARTWEPRLPDGDSAYFMAFNRGKKSVTLNLKDSRGAQIARDLATQADVVLENFTPGTMARMKLDYATLAALNPGLIYLSNTGFGQSGPYRDRRGYDTIFQALSGVMSLTGEAGGPPAKVGLPFADLTSGLWIAIAILTGVAARATSGRGSYIDLAMMDAQVNLLTIAAARYFALGEVATRMGTEHPGRVPSASFACAGGDYIHISASDQHWADLCAVLGLDDMAVPFAANAARLGQRDLVMARMGAAIAGRERAELAQALRARNIPAGEVNALDEILSDPHTLARGVVGAFRHGDATFPALRTPFNLEGFDPIDLTPPPALGADTEAVLSGLAGFDADAITRLRKEGVIL